MKDGADVTTPVGGPILVVPKTPFYFKWLTGKMGGMAGLAAGTPGAKRRESGRDLLLSRIVP
jgi:hypothetical protein